MRAPAIKMVCIHRFGGIETPHDEDVELDCGAVHLIFPGRSEDCSGCVARSETHRAGGHAAV
jgi:hypothetical protein